MTIWKVLRDYLIVILLAASVALFIRSLLFEAYRVPSEFMAPGLRTGDVIFVNKASYLLNARAERGDVILYSLFAQPEKDYLKRVIARAGDTVALQNCALILNGNNVTQAQTSVPPTGTHVENLIGPTVPIVWGPECVDLPQVVVPDGHVFVMGDNRGEGQDSRHWGFLPLSSIKGRAVLIWYARDKSRILKRVQ